MTNERRREEGLVKGDRPEVSLFVKAAERVRFVVPLLLCHLALTGDYTPRNWVLGLAVSSALVFLLNPRPRAFPWRRLPEIFAAAARYGALLARDIVESGFVVMRIVFNPSLPIRPGILRIHSGFDAPLGHAMIAHSITVTPGEMVIEMDDEGNLYTHCLNVEESARAASTVLNRRVELLRKILV